MEKERFAILVSSSHQHTMCMGELTMMDGIGWGRTGPMLCESWEALGSHKLINIKKCMMSNVVTAKCSLFFCSIALQLQIQLQRSWCTSDSSPKSTWNSEWSRWASRTLFSEILSQCFPAMYLNTTSWSSLDRYVTPTGTRNRSRQPGQASPQWWRTPTCRARPRGCG